jgi:hypothetical protein
MPISDRDAGNLGNDGFTKSGFSGMLQNHSHQKISIYNIEYQYYIPISIFNIANLGQEE